MYLGKICSHTFCKPSRMVAVVLFLALYAYEQMSYATMDPRFEIDTKNLVISPPVKPKAVSHSVKRIQKIRDKKRAQTNDAGTSYVVKAGDNLFKILMRDYGLSNEDADYFVDEIRLENNIYDIRRLKVGQKISIPPIRKNSDGTLRRGITGGLEESTPETVGQSFRLEPPVPSLSQQDIDTTFRHAWEKIVPTRSEDVKPIAIQTPSFSLTLSPKNYPMFSAMGSGKIVLDVDSNIPPLVKSLISEKDPAVTFVTASSANSRHLLSGIVSAAGFYSVEEDFRLEFGADPTLTVRSDFKVEKSPDSVLKQDVILLNSGRTGLPASVGNYLKMEGFTLHEPFAGLPPSNLAPNRPIYRIASNTPIGIMDSLLSSLSITSDKDCRLDIFSAGSSGITLSVNAERYFERGDQKTLVTHFDGDPVSYTLFRILETKGYGVVILESQDDFRNVTAKLLQRLNIKGTYAKHPLVRDSAANYSLHMSGYKFEGPGLPPDGIFVTDLEMDNAIHDVLTESGYTVSTK